MRTLTILLLGLVASATQLAASDPRYAVVWADGTRSTSPEIENWGAANWKPSLGRHLIFGGKNPARLILDTTQPRHRLRAPYIELQSGDRLAGRVAEYRDANEALGVPAHFLIELAVPLGLPKVFTRAEVRVNADAVRRIVAHPGDDKGNSPNWLQTIEGASESFRSWRWRSTGVDVLTTSGIKRFQFRELATIEVDRAGSWQAWLRQLALLSPALDSPLIRMELSDGSQLTTSLERLVPLSLGGEEPAGWFHLCQPAWSLDLLSVPYRQVRLRTILKPTETPLSALEAAVNRGRGLISPFPVQPHINENLAGEGLHCGGSEFGWGFAVHAPHELAFDLPQTARTFRTRLGLDSSVGDGGCARGFIRLDDKLLFASEVFSGSEQVVASPLLPVRGGRLSLIADAAVKERPANADPFDIRDDVDWLEPVVEHEPGELRREVDRQLSLVHPALSGWTPDSGDAGNWRLVNRLDQFDAAAAGFRLVLALEGPVTLSRRVASGSPQTIYLTLGNSIASEAATAEIWVDSRRVVHDILPRHTASPEPLRIAVPLAESSEKSVLMTVRLAPKGKSALIDWRGLCDEHGKQLPRFR
jgi:hypothetical protein